MLSLLYNELIIDRSSTSSYFQTVLLRDVGRSPSVFIRKYDTAAVVAIIRMQSKHPRKLQRNLKMVLVTIK